MRVKVSLMGRGLIGFNYNLQLAGLIYQSIRRANDDLAYELHSSKGYKFFTFSELRSKKRAVTKEGIFFKNCHFFVSSPRKEVISSLVEGLLQSPEVRINGVKFFLDSIEVLESPELGNSVTLSTLSPIIVRTARKENGKLRTIDLLPHESKFYENLRKNLVRKYESFYGEVREEIDFLKPISVKPKRIEIKGTYHRASHMTFGVKGDRKLIEFGYETGFGEKNSMGFGMVRVFDSKRRN